MRAILLATACILLLAAVAGCIGDEATIDDANLTEDPDQDENPWQAGLDEHHPTPSVAPTRSTEERRANVAEPGDPEFAAFDALVEDWMITHEIPTGTLAIMKDGQLRYEQGYGTTDRAETNPANASTMMRIASISKPMTAQTITMMVEEGHLAWDDPAFCIPPDPAPGCLLPLDPHPNRPVVDERIQNITLEHLRDHTAGFAEDGPCNDPLFSEGAIQAADTLNLPSPLPAWRVTQWLMGAKLAHDPGDTYDYCNAGYIALGTIAEAATGATLDAVLEAYLFRPLEIEGDIEPGRTLPEERNPREPFYACDHGKTQSVYDPSEEVCWPDGAWSMQAELANGGIIATAAATTAVMETLPIQWPSLSLGNIEHDSGHTVHWGAGGSMPGTRAYTGQFHGADTGTVQYAFIFNTRIPSQACDSPIGDILYATDTPGCNVRDLREAMLPLLRTWSTADQAPSDDSNTR